MRWVKRLLPVLFVAALGFAGWEYIRRSVRVSLSYCVEARFETAPPDDKELCRWLKAQPGVVPTTVFIGREGADKRVLRVGFIQSRNMAGHPPFPALESACGELGYAGPALTFRDSVDRSITGSSCD